jgi:signal transduction histidine kinase
MIWSWFHRSPRVVDVSLVVLLVAAAAVVRAGPHRSTAIALGICEALPLLVRRRFPAVVLASVSVIALAMNGFGVWLNPLPLGVALYTLTSTRTGPRYRALAAAAIVAVGVAALAGRGLEFGAAAARVVFLIAAALLGESIGSRRAYVREIEEKAARLEREQETESRRATAEEQARIARELHDVIAHALSVIVVQAGAADDAFDHDPLQAREPVRAVDAAARAALADLRRVLGILQETPDYEPQPSLNQLDLLVDRVRGTGLAVSLEIEGKPRPLPTAVDLSAYRIVQEALTNTLKHAGAEHVRIRVRYGETLGLEVEDDGAGANGHGDGTGLVGMRERVGLLGGTVRTGPASSGGYRVTADIPVESSS